MKHSTLIVLAAGASKRFGGEKLLAQWKGRPLLAHTLERFRNAEVQRRIVVARPGAHALAELSRKQGYEVLENPLADDGIGHSIALAAGQCVNSDGVMIALGDMPTIAETTIDAVIAAWRGASDRAIVAPIFRGRRGHPVILSKHYIPELTALKGDRGASGVIGNHNLDLVGVEVDDPGVTVDFDEPADFMETNRNLPNRKQGSNGDTH